MGDAMLTYVKSQDFDRSEGTELVELYKLMIEKLSDRLNPLKYALITIACSRDYESIEDSIKFVEEAMGRMKRYQQAVYLLRISIAEKKLRLGEHHDCKEMLDTIS
jgi:hypothetical protein